jgi:hypothetical protein
MTEEFMNIFAKIGKTPFEEQMKQTIKSFENMVHIFMEMPEKIDNRLDSIQAQINSLEAQINMLIKKVAELQGSSNPSRLELGPGPTPSPTPTANKINPAVAKKEVMNELRDLLEKRKRQLDNE